MENRRLGEVIRRRRKIRGLTLGQVAVKVGVSAAAISKIERNLVGEPGIMTITGIALAL
ncbi:MAG: helix-turn-helix domain-containing protein, partial [Armatimonadetes bacterium]|nr:helix-turn-helix domain-containing protein [Armatimonadota bacterium]